MRPFWCRPQCGGCPPRSQRVGAQYGIPRYGFFRIREVDMQELANRVAVITGAASGIGRGIAQQLAREGMKLVLADFEERPLAEAEQALRAAGAHTLAVVTDVSRRDSVFALADRAFATFGAVHILCNNAGVSGGLHERFQ
jgi:NAD(P)-dependent dehydrogenase (short-subunit alcohol dehydrogenase family)